MTFQQLNELSPRSLDLRKHKMMNKRDWKLEEVKLYLENRQNKLFLSKQDVHFNTDGKDLSIKRVIGEKERMVGLGRW